MMPCFGEIQVFRVLRFGLRTAGRYLDQDVSFQRKRMVNVRCYVCLYVDGVIVDAQKRIEWE